jgi:aspartyl protease family protein
MALHFKMWRSLYFKGALLILGLCPGGAGATEVGLVGIIGSKAILSIDGGSPRTLSSGQEYGGVKLLSTQGDSATVTIDGKRRVIKIGQSIVDQAPSNNKAAVVMVSDARGHFQTSGTINGHSANFLVDTGASAISMGASDAKRLGLNLNNAQRGMSQTANGVTMVYRVKLDTVKVGDIVLHNVDGVVHPSQNMPIILLGMSFLSRVNMQTDGRTLTLKTW